jgi:hypothetical protein
MRFAAVCIVVATVHAANLRGDVSLDPTALFKAARMGRMELLRRMVARAAAQPGSTLDMSWHNPKRMDATPLHAAVDRGHADAVEVLVGAGADVDAINKFGATPMHEAAASGRVAIGKLLLKLGASLAVADSEFQYYPLDVAHVQGHADFAAWLESEHAPCSSHCYGRESADTGGGSDDDEVPLRAAPVALDESWFADDDDSAAASVTSTAPPQQADESWFDDDDGVVTSTVSHSAVGAAVARGASSPAAAAQAAVAAAEIARAQSEEVLSDDWFA